ALRVHTKTRVTRQVEFDSAVDVGDVHGPQRRFCPQFHDAIAVLYLHLAGHVFQVNVVGARIQFQGAGDGAGAQVAVAHVDFTIELGQLQIGAHRLQVQRLADAGELKVAVIAGVEVQGAAQIGNISIVHGAFDLHVSGYVLDRNITAQV